MKSRKGETSWKREKDSELVERDWGEVMKEGEEEDEVGWGHHCGDHIEKGREGRRKRRRGYYRKLGKDERVRSQIRSGY